MNSSAHVSIDNAWGFNKYTVFAMPGSHLTVVYFNISTDVIDISDFHNIVAFSDLVLKKGSVIIDLTHVQSIHILNLHPANMSAANFVFYESSVDDSTSITVRTLSVVAGVLVALAGLFFVACLSYRIYENNRLKAAALIKSDRNFFMVIKTNADGSDIVDLEESLRQLRRTSNSDELSRFIDSEDGSGSGFSSFEMSSISLSTRKSAPIDRAEQQVDSDSEDDEVGSVSAEENEETPLDKQGQEDDSLSSFAVSDFTEDLNMIV